MRSGPQLQNIGEGRALVNTASGLSNMILKKGQTYESHRLFRRGQPLKVDVFAYGLLTNDEGTEREYLIVGTNTRSRWQVRNPQKTLRFLDLTLT